LGNLLGPACRPAGAAPACNSSRPSGRNAVVLAVSARRARRVLSHCSCTQPLPRPATRAGNSTRRALRPHESQTRNSGTPTVARLTGADVPACGSGTCGNSSRHQRNAVVLAASARRAHRVGFFVRAQRCRDCHRYWYCSRPSARTAVVLAPSTRRAVVSESLVVRTAAAAAATRLNSRHDEHDDGTRATTTKPWNTDCGRLARGRSAGVH